MKYSDDGDYGLAGRRRMLKLFGLGISTGFAVLAGRPLFAATAGLPPVTVYKNPSCGCCGIWSDYMRAQGFQVTVVKMDDLGPVKRKARVPGDLETCHTAFIDGYVVEGHVPAPAIMKLLKERPNVIGIAVPGMPAGSPGMPTVNPEPFHAIAFAADGGRRIYMSF